MQKSFKLFVATFLFTLSLTSVSLAGETQCPVVPPPPPPPTDGDGFSVQTNTTANDSYELMMEIWDYIVPVLF